MEGALKLESVSTKQKRIAKLARENPKMALTSLNHYLDLAWLREAYADTRKDGAVGTDGQTAERYEAQLETNLQNLLNRMKSGTYKAPAIRRVYIPKGDGTQRPLGIPTFEDKIAQRAVAMLLEPIYEQDFSECSFGFRRGRSAHQALRTLRNQIMNRSGRWILDLDLRKYFDTIDHQHLRRFLARRVTDGVIRKLIDKWLKAGVLDRGVLSRPKTGTPQGGVISPILSNIYLHVVLDEWFRDIVAPRLGLKASMVRYADDAVLVFQGRWDAERVYKVIGKRLEKYGLSLHPEKTKLVDFRFKSPTQTRREDHVTKSFDFLGFTHYWGKSRQGKWVVFQKTARSRLARTLKGFNQYCKRNRHMALSVQHQQLSRRLMGHYGYFGITGNSRSLRILHHQVARIWRKWLSRRSRKSNITWEKFTLVLERFPLPKPKIIHRYTSPVGERT